MSTKLLLRLSPKYDHEVGKALYFLLKHDNYDEEEFFHALSDEEKGHFEIYQSLKRYSQLVSILNTSPDNTRRLESLMKNIYRHQTKFYNVEMTELNLEEYEFLLQCSDVQVQLRLKMSKNLSSSKSTCDDKSFSNVYVQQIKSNNRDLEYEREMNEMFKNKINAIKKAANE